MKFIQAAHYTPANRKVVDLIVLHSAESLEKPTVAENIAAWFAGPKAPQASAHYVIDRDEVIQCVREADVAWGAPGANHNGIHIEHAGKAGQTPGEWADVFSMGTLLKSIDLCTDICRRWAIPAVYVDIPKLRAGQRGITTHLDVSLAFGKSNHTDPGFNFPVAWLIGRVAARLSSASPAA